MLLHRGTYVVIYMEVRLSSSYHKNMFVLCVTFLCCSQITWPRKFIEEKIYLHYDSRGLRTSGGGTEAWHQEQEAESLCLKL